MESGIDKEIYNEHAHCAHISGGAAHQIGKPVYQRVHQTAVCHGPLDRSGHTNDQEPLKAPLAPSSTILMPSSRFTRLIAADTIPPIMKVAAISVYDQLRFRIP